MSRLLGLTSGAKALTRRKIQIAGRAKDKIFIKTLKIFQSEGRLVNSKSQQTSDSLSAL